MLLLLHYPCFQAIVKRIVLLSDGEENAGSVSKIAQSIQQQGIDLKYFRIHKEIGKRLPLKV